MSTLKVNTIRHSSASSDAVTLASDGTCTAKITNNLSNRNLIINGAMNVAQRGTSATANGYGTVDRFQEVVGGSDELATQTQHDLTSSDTGPWAAGFRHSYHVQNGNQTGGAGTGDHAYVAYTVEARDIANSGWDYTSASSYITLSFWVKSSVEGQQYAYFYCPDGTAQGYSFDAGDLSANTWTKVTAKIPGNSNLTFNNDNGGGMYIYWGPFWGTDYTDSGNTLNTWAAYSSSSRTPEFPSAWWTTNDATFEITGVQLEVGDTATDFEHRSYGDELARCQRYYYRAVEGNGKILCIGFVSGSTEVSGFVRFPGNMRSSPDIHQSSGSNYWRIGAGALGGDKYISGSWGKSGQTEQGILVYAAPDVSLTAGEPGYIDGKNAASFMAFTSEL